MSYRENREMHKATCAECNKEMAVCKVGVYVVEWADALGPGPYKIWAGDAFQCPQCNKRIVAGFNLNPLSVQHEADFRNLLASIRDASHGGAVVVDVPERLPLPDH